jgi:hypothetical protein
MPVPDAPAEERETPVGKQSLDLLIAMAKDWTDSAVVRDAPERVPHVIAQLIEAIEGLRALPAEDRAVTQGEQSGGVALIAAERARQEVAEGWSAQHDDQHETGELLAAAARYLDAGSDYDLGGRLPDWPWEPHWFKSSDDLIRNLVKAGALIAAEIDRQQRKAALIAGAEDRAVTAPPVPPPADARWFPDPPPGPSRAVTAPQEQERIENLSHSLAAAIERAIHAESQLSPSPTRSRRCEERWSRLTRCGWRTPTWNSRKEGRHA